jgi:CubicO group peptidase (beta-lactamase class C family)
MGCWLAAAGLGAESGPVARAQSQQVADGIALLDLWIQEQLTYRSIPGLAIGVVHGGDLVWAKGYGCSDRESRAPILASTSFRLGSVSKLFTATAILQLRDRDKLALDDPVVRHLPWFALANQSPAAPPITIRHLLTHTAGLPREAAFPYWTTHQFPSREAIRAALPSQTAVYPPGETYKYSNLGAALLGEIVVAASGEEYAEYLRRHLFAPLRMTATTAAPTAAQIAGLARQYGRLLADGSRGTFAYYDTGGLAPAAAVVSNLEDLARFAAFHLGHGDSSAAPVLQASTLAEMRRPQFVYPSWSGGRGLGFALSRRQDTTFVSHSGWIGGHRVEFLLEPERDIAVIAFTNADDASPGFFARQAFDLVGRPLAAAAAPAAPPVREPDPAWQRYLGIYSDPWNWEYQVLVLGGGLVMYDHAYPPEEDPESAVTTLTPAGAHTFRMPDGEMVVFEMGEDGSVLRLRRRYEILLPKRADR